MLPARRRHRPRRQLRRAGRRGHPARVASGGRRASPAAPRQPGRGRRGPPRPLPESRPLPLPSVPDGQPPRQPLPLRRPTHCPGSLDDVLPLALSTDPRVRPRPLRMQHKRSAGTSPRQALPRRPRSPPQRRRQQPRPLLPTGGHGGSGCTAAGRIAVQCCGLHRPLRSGRRPLVQEFPRRSRPTLLAHGRRRPPQLPRRRSAAGCRRAAKAGTQTSGCGHGRGRWDADGPDAGVRAPRAQALRRRS
mmetsp:Transcript_111300/g.355072  ORF Transcript_111300/g.355072 Transcript_111300/m.355072 type:complete len:247 (-) Transcript_111300:16-756(-)